MADDAPIPEQTPKPQVGEIQGSPAQPANAADARKNLEIMRQINKAGSKSPHAADAVAAPSNAFAKLPQNTSAAECQSYVNLLNTPPASSELGAFRFGEYLLKKRPPPGPPGRSTWGPEDRKLIQSDIYRSDPAALLASAAPGKFEKPPSYVPVAQRVFANTTFDLGRNHNSLLDANLPELMRQNGINPKEPVSLINVDAHSDISEGYGNGSLADWVNRALKDNPNITDFYWVTPDDFATGALKSKFYPAKEPKEVAVHLIDSGKDKTLFVSKSGQVFWNNVPFDYKTNASNYRIVQFHKRTLADMPDMHGKAVALTTDLDYFDNRGFDTANNARVNWKGEAGFQQYLDTLDKKGIHPFYHFVSASPEYVTKEHMNDLLRFAAYVGDSSKNGQPYEFSHRIDYRDGAYGSHGVAEPSQGNRGAEIMWRLFSNDLKTTQPDGQVVINKPNEERTAAIQAVIKYYRTNTAGALKILRGLDASDGTTDGVINFRLVEAEASRVCSDK